MEVLKFNLSRPTIPQKDDPLEINTDPILCSSCMNLYAASANSMITENGVHAGDENRLQKIRIAEEDGEPVEPIPAWAGVTRPDYASYEVQSYLTDIRSAAERGCETCAMLQAVVLRLGGGAISFSDPCHAAIIRFCRGSSLKVIVSRIEKDDYGSDSDSDDFFFPSSGGREELSSMMVEELGSFELYTLPRQRTPWFSLGSLLTDDTPRVSVEGFSAGRARHVPTSPNTQPAFSLIRGWLEDCTENHEACRQARSPLSMPKRVIHVGDESNTTVRLVETDNASLKADEKNSPRYLALSHCWGQSVHLVTEKATLKDRKSNIAWDSLPPTFQDAVTITRNLGFDYVWIDSLCIIQDDAQDWVTEASKMASIYEGARLVLAATSSVDGDGGCLFEREPYLEVQGESHDGVPYTFFARKGIKHSVFNSDLTFERLERGPEELVVRPYPLFTRAWCFQERLLATRMLHFTKGEMVFDCLTEVNCECGRLRRFTHDTLRRSRQVAKLGTPVGSDFFGWTTVLDQRWGVTRKNRPAPTSSETWRQLVFQYSEKAITRNSDRLPALSGLASIWPGKEIGQYMAGIWAGDVSKSLLWTANSPNLKEKQEYIAPSWSWASSHGGIQWVKVDGEDAEFFITVDQGQSDCLPATTDPFGSVKSGWLSIKGRVLKCKLESLQDTGGFVRRRGYATSFSFDEFGVIEPLVGEEVICLRLCAFPPSVVGTALILARPTEEYLKRLPDSVQRHPNVFRRVGITRYFEAREWHYDTDSEEMEMYLV